MDGGHALAQETAFPRPAVRVAACLVIDAGVLVVEVVLVVARRREADGGQPPNVGPPLRRRGRECAGDQMRWPPLAMESEDAPVKVKLQGEPALGRRGRLLREKYRGWERDMEMD